MLVQGLDVFAARLSIYDSDSPRVAVTKKSWHKTRFRPGWDSFEDMANRNTRPAPRRPARVIEGYTYTAKIRNNAEKTITVVGWDYTFRYAENEKPTHHRFYSRVKIEPGKQKAVSRFISTPPTRTVDARAAGQKMIEEVIVYFIEYEDGSIWKRPSPETSPESQ